MPRTKKQRLKRRKDGRFACRYKDQWFYGQTQEEALEAREQFKAQERRGLYMPVTVREYAKEWLPRAHPNVSPATRKGLEIHLEKLFSGVGDMCFEDVRPSDIKAIYSARYNGVSNTYVKAGAQLFSSLFDAAVADGYITVNPARDKTAKPHKGTVGGHRAITPQERYWIENLCKDNPVYAVVMTMLYTGVRPQEVKAIKIERDVDFEAGAITLHEFVHVAGGQQYRRDGIGKTPKAIRTIPLFEPLRKVLEGRRGYLITNKEGKPVSISDWTNLWARYKTAMETEINGIKKCIYGRTREQKKLAAEGKLPPWIDFTVVPYDLRHSFCALLCRDNGVELKTCIKWMGHSDPQMILKIYDEVTPERDEKEANRLNQLLIRGQNGSQ